MVGGVRALILGTQEKVRWGIAPAESKHQVRKRRHGRKNPPPCHLTPPCGIWKIFFFQGSKSIDARTYWPDDLNVLMRNKTLALFFLSLVPRTLHALVSSPSLWDCLSWSITKVTFIKDYFYLFLVGKPEFSHCCCLFCSYSHRQVKQNDTDRGRGVH